MQNILKNIEGLGINLEDLKPKKKQITSIESSKQQVAVSCKGLREKRRVAIEEENDNESYLTKKMRRVRISFLILFLLFLKISI